MPSHQVLAATLQLRHPTCWTRVVAITPRSMRLQWAPACFFHHQRSTRPCEELTAATRLQPWPPPRICRHHLPRPPHGRGEQDSLRQQDKNRADLLPEPAGSHLYIAKTSGTTSQKQTRTTFLHPSQKVHLDLQHLHFPQLTLKQQTTLS